MEATKPALGATYSALIGWTATRAVPAALRGLAYRAFARAVGANLDETELELGAYESLGDFFARRLRPGARPIEPDPAAVISPCDGVVAAIGTASAGELVQAKGRHYQLAELLADDALAARLTGGAYATIYLSPRDYHRVHTPIDAQIVGYRYLPGALWPVNPLVAARRDALLSRNERVVIHLRSPAAGDFALVMVGAAGVGNIRLAHPLDPDHPGGRAPDSATLRGSGEHYAMEFDDIEIARGDELGAFRLGSTVVMVAEPGRLTFAGEVGQAVRFGERFGQLAEGPA